MNKGKLQTVNESKQKVKPFLKWAGGKGQLVNAFENYYPHELKRSEIQYYYEPFIGGGAVFFNLVQNYQFKSTFIYDINEELILTYIVVQRDVVKLIEILKEWKEKYESLIKEKQIQYYYKLREDFNLQKISIDFNNYSGRWILRAAQIIFMNKTCFNGLFRFNANGKFNVPAGRYKNPKILDEINILRASELLKNTEIKCADFLQMEKDIKNNSFVYFDPPYRPLSKTSNFTSYSKDGFDDAQQIKLAELFKRLNKKGVKLMLSNSDPKNINPGDNFFDDIYRNYHIVRIPAKRMINSDASKRNSVNEIIVTNY